MKSFLGGICIPDKTSGDEDNDGTKEELRRGYAAMAMILELIASLLEPKFIGTTFAMFTTGLYVMTRSRKVVEFIKSVFGPSPTYDKIRADR